MIIDQKTLVILATAFCNGKKHDFQLFKATYAGIAPEVICLADSGYQGIAALHEKSETPTKKSKHHPLTAEQKERNRSLSQKRIFCEHVIGKLKIFRILKERYRNRRQRFGLRFNLISALYNLSLVTY